MVGWWERDQAPPEWRGLVWHSCGHPTRGRPMGLSGRVCLAPARVRLRECDGNSHALPQSVSWRIARRFALGKSSAVTTRELETLADAVSRLAASRSRCDRSRRSVWRAWRADLLGRIHGAMKPAVRPYAGKVLVGTAASLLADLERAWRWADELDEFTDASEGELALVRQQRAELEGEQQETASRMAALEHELAQAAPTWPAGRPRLRWCCRRRRSPSSRASSARSCA